MADPPYDSSKRDRMSAPSAAARLHAGRYLLLGAGMLFLGASAFFALPIAYAAAAILGLVAVVALAPGSPAPAIGNESGASAEQDWSDIPMSATVEAVPQPAFMLDSGGTVRHANRHAAVLFPATRPGDRFALTFRRPEFAGALDIAASGTATSLEFREPGQSSNVYAVTLSPLSPPGGRVSFILITFDDVSDRQAIARMRADFVANASHELRTPLASLTGFIETLLGPARNDPVASEKFLHVMLDQARRMRRLIDDLLSLSRVEMRAHSRPTDRVDLVAVVGHVGDAMQPLAADNSVALRIDMPAEPVTVVGERDELIQLVQNLVENAIRYGASGGRVDIRLELRPEGRSVAVISIEDHGPGIAAEHLPRLTERFYRVDVGASRAMKGTGLGLAIVKHILTRHGGRLVVKSEPGKGALFSAELPLP